MDKSPSAPEELNKDSTKDSNESEIVYPEFTDMFDINPDQKYKRINVIEYDGYSNKFDDGFYEYFNIKENRIVSKYQLKNHKVNGIFLSYYNDNTLKFIGNFINDVGCCIFIDINGNKEYHCYFDIKNHKFLKYMKKYERYYENRTWKSRLLYEGEYDNSWKNGKYYQEGKLKYEGEFQDRKFHGQGKYYESGVIKYEGEFRNGKFYQGKEYHEDGTLKKEGVFNVDPKSFCVVC